MKSLYNLILILAILPSLALANAPIINLDLTNYILKNQNDLGQILYENVRESVFRLGENCSDKVNIPFDNVIIIQPVEFESSMPHPVKGVWLHKYRVNRCGFDRTYNMYFIAIKGRSPVYATGVMGNTEASLQLTHDLIPTLLTATSKIKDGCKTEDEHKDIMIFDSYVTKTHKTGWDEIWKIKGCNQIVDVKINFTHDGKGGAFFSINPSEVIYKGIK